MPNSVKFVGALPPASGRRTSSTTKKVPKEKKAKSVPRRRCPSRFDNGVSIVECSLRPGHYDFHQAENMNDGWWADKQEYRGVG